MGRMRTVKPETFRSRSLAKCSIEARYTFIGLWTEADDHGRGVADPRILKGALYPLDDDCTHLHVSAHVRMLVETGHIRLYEVDGEAYFEILKWTRHQAASYRRGEPKYPPPPAGQDDSQDSAHERMQESASRTRESAGTGNREQGTGNREGKAPAKPKPRKPTPITDDFAVSDDLRSWAQREVPNVDIEIETKKFIDHHVANENSFKQPDRAWQKWMRQADQWSKPKPRQLPPVATDFSDWEPQNAA